MPTLVFEGNSLTAGTGLPSADSYPSQLIASLGQSADWHNLATSGSTIAAITARAGGVDVKKKSNGAPQVVVFWGGTNDLYLGRTAAEVYADIKAYCQTRKNFGWTVIVIAIPPYTAGTQPADFEANRQSVNASLRADFSTDTGLTNIKAGASYADFLADIGSDSDIGVPGASDNPVYYYDKVHMTAAGYAIVAAYVRDALSFILPYLN